MTAASCHPGSHSIMGMLSNAEGNMCQNRGEGCRRVELMSPVFSHSWERSQSGSGSAGNVVGNSDCDSFLTLCRSAS